MTIKEQNGSEGHKIEEEIAILLFLHSQPFGQLAAPHPLGWGCFHLAMIPGPKRVQPAQRVAPAGLGSTDSYLTNYKLTRDSSDLLEIFLIPI